MKQKIMEALLDSNHNLTKDEIVWAASHLPSETSQKGEYALDFTFDHEKENLFEAIGVDPSDSEKTAEILSLVTKKCALEPNYRISNGVEEILNSSKNIQGFIPLVLVHILRSTLEKIEKDYLGSKEGSSPMKDLLELLKEMKKRSGN